MKYKIQIKEQEARWVAEVIDANRKVVYRTNQALNKDALIAQGIRFSRDAGVPYEIVKESN